MGQPCQELPSRPLGASPTLLCLSLPLWGGVCCSPEAHPVGPACCRGCSSFLGGAGPLPFVTSLVEHAGGTPGPRPPAWTVGLLQCPSTVTRGITGGPCRPQGTACAPASLPCRVALFFLVPRHRCSGVPQTRQNLNSSSLRFLLSGPRAAGTAGGGRGGGRRPGGRLLLHSQRQPLRDGGKDRQQHSPGKINSG